MNKYFYSQLIVKLIHVLMKVSKAERENCSTTQMLPEINKYK